MTDSLRGRLAVDFTYANHYLKLLDLGGDGTAGERVDRLIHEICLPKTDSLSGPHLIRGSSRLESLKLLLLMKFELPQISQSLKTSLMSVQTSKIVLDLCLFDFDSSNPSVNSDVLEINLLLLDENDTVEIATSFFKTCRECLGNFLLSGACRYKGLDLSPFNILNLVESTLNVLFEKSTAKSGSFAQFFILDDTVEIGNVFVDLAFNDDNSLSSQTLLKIFPRFSLLPLKVPLLESLWGRVKLHWKGIKWNEFKYHKLYHVLCSLSNHLFPQKLKRDPENWMLIVKDNTLWEVILFGIGQKDSLIRKQSRLLLRKALDFIQLNSSCIGTSLKLELLNWRVDSSNDFFKVWSEYFLVLEALEEKQTHLIEPILKNYEISTSPKFNVSISSAWNLPVYLGMLNHDSNSIVKWGLRLFLTQNLDLYSSPSVNIDYFILYPLIEALNNNYLYVKQEDEFDIEYSLQKLFSSFVNMLKEVRHNFYSLILSRMCSINWGPVSLFFVMRALSSVVVDDRPWNNSSLATMKLFLTNTIHTHSPLIRGAVQSCLLSMMVNFSDINSLSLFHLADIFGMFCCNEALKRGSESWEFIVNWLKTFVNEEKASNFITCSLSQFIDSSAATNPGVCVNAKAFTRMCLLLFDASFFLVGGEVDQTNAFYHLMHPLFRYYVNISFRPYVPNTVIDCNIKVLSNFVEECNCMSSSNDITKRVILVVTYNLLEEVICCYSKRLLSVGHVDDYGTVQSYIQALYIFSKEKKLLPYLLKVSEGLVNNAFLNLESQKDLTLTKYFSMKILSWLASLLIDAQPFCTRYFIHCRDKLSEYMKNYVCSGHLSKSCDVIALCESDCNRNIHTLKARIKSEYLQLHWNVLHCLLEVGGVGKEVILSMRKPDLFMSDAMESVETGGREILSPVMSVLQLLLPRVIKDSLDLALECCSVCWKATFEHKKSDYFWVAIEQFIKMMFQEEIMLMTKCEKHILKYAQYLYSHGQTVERIFQLFISHLSNEISLPKLWKSYYTVLVDALVFGPLLRKDQRVYKDTCDYILSFGPKYCLNSSLACDLSYSTSIRVKAVAFLVNIVKIELETEDLKSSTPNIAGEVADHLWHNVLQTTKEKSRYYGNSHVHRLKQRAMQSLLLLEMALNENQCQHLMDSLCDSLQVESHQPSVKYLQEWLLVRIIAHHPMLRQRMWTVFQQAGVKRPGCMSSFISVTFHLSKALPHDELEEFIGKCIEYIHPWCMAQQFIVRLFAQVVLQKLWEIIIKENFEKTLTKYKVVFDCVNSSLEQGGNTQRNLMKLKESFYFEVFHPLDHFSIETIFYDIPRLGNVSNDEWIPPSEFESVELHSLIKLKNESEVLRQSNGGDWALKTNVCRIESPPTDGEVNINVQKKIMPWKVGDVEETAYFLEDMERGKQQGRRVKRNGGLVVVASLVDRMPNLGGLCRTCEAFGVAEYVLGSLKYTEDPQFQNLSVSAERWISISEVKPFMLSMYLTSMKEKGFSLIGAEQTSSSVKLDCFKFPEKSVLLLGNEKEGIPADILPLMDVCVEVPQEGLIRSLNVHVTGAIFIWEYLRQHHPSSSSS